MVFEVGDRVYLKDYGGGYVRGRQGDRLAFDIDRTFQAEYRIHYVLRGFTRDQRRYAGGIGYPEYFLEGVTA